jgi:lambda family phage portal protein
MKNLPNPIDKVIEYFAPIKGAQRLRARAIMSSLGGYIGARRDRNATKTWYATSGDADSSTLYDLQTLRDRSRDLIRNTPLATGAVETTVLNAVGRGLQLQSRPDAEALKMTPEQADEWKSKTEREFRLWAESNDCDITRTQNFYGLQSLSFRATIEGGDCFALLPFVKSPLSPYELKVQLIEADRVCNPSDQLMDTETLRAGVELDQYGAPIAYHIRKRHPFSYAGALDRASNRVEAFGKKTGRRNVLHMIDRKRIGQTRGVPFLAPVIEPLKQLDRYTEAEVMAAVISAMFTVFVETPGAVGLGDAIANADAADKSKGEVALGNGSIVDLNPGEKVSFANPNRPSANFDPFVQAILRQIGVALGLPFEVLIKHFTASYSAARAALLEAWAFYMSRREFLVNSFCQPVYEAWMEEAVALGRIDAPGFFADTAMRRAYLQAEWVGSAPQQIDPQKEVEAAKTRIEIGVSTREDETLLLTGKTYSDQHAQQVREKNMRVRDGLQQDVNTQPPSTTGKPSNGGNDTEGLDQADQGDQQQPDNAPPSNGEMNVNVNLSVAGGNSAGPQVLKTGRAERRKDGSIAFVIEESTPTRIKTGSAVRGKEGELQFVVEEVKDVTPDLSTQ